MAQYRKKPVTIEAELFDGTQASFDKICWFVGAASLPLHDDTSTMIIHTLEGDMVASAGDYIIKGVKGEFYPCKPDIFAETYDEVF